MIKTVVVRGLLAGVLLTSVACEVQDAVMLADGSSAQFGHWDGRWLVINYWAEWCAPCRKEIPELNRLHSERASSGVVVLGVNYDGIKGDSLATLAKELGIEFPVLVEDPRRRWNLDPPSILPSTLIINPRGELQQVLVGPQHYEDFRRVLDLTEKP